ncbi:MAG: GDSL-type esterase/lipase family protein [Eubacteriales bacterium]
MDNNDRIREVRQTKIRIVVAVVLAVAAVLIITAVVRGRKADAVTAADLAKENVTGTNAGDVSKGIAFLEEKEAVSTESIENKIRAQEAADQSEQRDQILSDLENGSGDIWSLFSDAVILGDSRAMGFSTFEYLPTDRVFASTGDTVDQMEQYFDQISTLNPSVIFVCYGMNDILKQLNPDGATIASLFRDELSKLRQAAPEAKIYVNSILPASAAGQADQPSLSVVPDVNAALKQMTQEEGYGWIDCDGIVSEHQDMYDEDGVHFVTDFYPIWAKQMMLQVYAPEGEASDGGSTGDAADSQESTDTGGTDTGSEDVSAENVNGTSGE